MNVWRLLTHISSEWLFVLTLFVNDGYHKTVNQPTWLNDSKAASQWNESNLAGRCREPFPFYCLRKTMASLFGDYFVRLHFFLSSGREYYSYLFVILPNFPSNSV